MKMKSSIIVKMGLTFLIGLLVGLILNIHMALSPIISNTIIQNFPNSEFIVIEHAENVFLDNLSQDAQPKRPPSFDLENNYLKVDQSADQNLDDYKGFVAQPVVPSFHKFKFHNKSIHTDHVKSKISNLLDRKSTSHVYSDVIEGVYWTENLEILLPFEFSDFQMETWKRNIASNKVIELKTGCGRMQNRLLKLLDSSKVCARYRINTDQIQGEIYSYHLSKLLGIRNIPPSVLAKPNPANQLWSSVHLDLINAEWNPNKLVVLTPWIDNLQPVYIPSELRKNDPTLHPSEKLLVNRTINDLLDLVQWSDLIILDYLTANVDRVVNNLFNLQWNTDMMSNPTHNLQRTSHNGQLVFLDNESGLFHSYRLLDKYDHYHTLMLKALCIFRKSTAHVISKLHTEKNVGILLKELFENKDSLASHLPRIPDTNLKTLQKRIGDVYNQIQLCESTFAR